MGPVERRVRRQAARWVYLGNPASEAMAVAAVTLARRFDMEGNYPRTLRVVLSHLRDCSNPPDPLDEIRARGCARWADPGWVREGDGARLIRVAR